ncbi:hypothetical protein MKW98_004834, partial [Papaver atlanticum]
MDVTVCKLTECPKAEVKVGVESDKVKLDIVAKKNFHALVIQEVGYEKLAFDNKDLRYIL